MPLNYNHLYYFHLAAIEGSVAGAAERLGVTAATVSEQVRALERALGRKLFERMQTGLQLTDAGRVTFEHTTPMFRIGERLAERVGIEHRPARALRVGVSGPTARSSTARLVAPLFALEDCLPTLRSGDTAELIRELRAGTLDLVLCEIEPSDSMRRGLEVMLVHRMRLVAIAAPDVQPAKNWEDARLVHYRATTSYRHDVEAHLEAKGLRPLVAGEADDPMVLVEAAARGGCITIVPEPVAKDAIALGRVRLLGEIDAANAGVHALYQKNVPARQAVESLIAAARSDKRK